MFYSWSPVTQVNRNLIRVNIYLAPSTLTGTPHGVGFTRIPPVYLRPGDVVSIHIEKIGILTNPVILEE